VAPFPLTTLRNFTDFLLSLQRQPPTPPSAAPKRRLSPAPSRPLFLTLPAADNRANQSVGFLAGFLPATVSKRPTSLLAVLLLRVAQDAINQRLFETVRERDHLAYEAALSCHLAEGLFLVSVPCHSEERALATVAACREALRSLHSPLSPSELQAHVLRAKQLLLEQSESAQFWLDGLHDGKVSSPVPSILTPRLRSL
jgi:predicted Zn-dependent peptidase